MRFILWVFFFCRIAAFSSDFDCAIVGTSPFSLFEALYQSHLGKRVVILEEASSCGGAWKSIDICGVSHADLGCHQIGHDMQLKQFLEEYAGCKMVSMDKPLEPFHPSTSPNGYYFSKGCYELIDHLQKLIEAASIVLLLNHKAESVSIDPSGSFVTVKTKDQELTTAKMIVTPMSQIEIESSSQAGKHHSKSKYCHLYLLVQDPTPPRFSYHGGHVASGVSRTMNLTHFTGLAETGRQLLVFQTHGDPSLANGQVFLDGLKSQNLIDPSAFILRSEPFLYETASLNQAKIQQAGASHLIEVMNTGHFQNLSTYIPKWKQALQPYSQIIGSL